LCRDCCQQLPAVRDTTVAESRVTALLGCLHGFTGLIEVCRARFPAVGDSANVLAKRDAPLTPTRSCVGAPDRKVVVPRPVGVGRGIAAKLAGCLGGVFDEVRDQLRVADHRDVGGRGCLDDLAGLGAVVHESFARGRDGLVPSGDETP